MATHSSILAWEILWTEEPGRLHTVVWGLKSQTELGHHTTTTWKHAASWVKKKKNKKKPPSLFFFVMSVSFKEAKGLKLPIYKDESLLP